MPLHTNELRSGRLEEAPPALCRLLLLREEDHMEEQGKTKTVAADEERSTLPKPKAPLWMMVGASLAW